MERTASDGSCLDNWEDGQAEASRHEIQLGAEFSLFLDPAPTPGPYHPVSSSSCPEIASISGSNKEAGASFEPARARLPLTGSAVTSQSSFFDLDLSLLLSISDAKDGDRASPDAEDDDGGDPGDTTEAVEKEHMFDKVVTPSDVGKLNRLVVPKQHAEKYFPLDAAASPEGLLLSFEDRTGKLWRFRYSFWNSSQSYVMTKGWSRFVRDKRLDAGDTISFYRRSGVASPHYIDYKRCTHRRHQCRLPGLLSPMQPVPLLVPFRIPTEMIQHAPMMEPPPAMPKLKLANANTFSSPSVIRSYIKRLFQQLVQVRTIISSRGRVSMSDGWLAAVKYLASDARECLQDLHYLMLLAMLERNKKAGSDEASSSKTTPTGSSQFGYAENDKIHKITPILDKLIDGGLQLSGAAGRDDCEMLSVSHLVSNCILLCRGILGIIGVIGIDNMSKHRELPVAACDDLTYSGHVKISRMNAQAIPTCVADPIYLLPTAIRSLLYLDLSSCSDLMKLPASLGTLHNLSALNLSCCYSLYMLPESIGNLESLQILVLSFCCKLQCLPLSFGNLSKLRFLDFSGCFGLETLPDSFVNLANLENLNLSDCKRLKGIPQPFGNLQKLMYLNLSGCSRLELQVEYMRGLANLKCLTLSPHTDIQGFPVSLGYLAYHLDLSRWWKNNWVHPNCKPKAPSLHSYKFHEENIIGMLLSHCSDEGDVASEQSVTSICIVGESGMGKTELVHRIYNDQMILDAFNLKIWICMCDKKRLLEKIIEFTTGTYCDEVPLSILEETVREELIGKRFLLVLDNADIEDQCFWSDVLKLLNVGAEGSALIVTTKSEVVDLLVGEMHTIYLNSLSKEESFMVFQEHAFGGFDMNNYQQLANIGCKVVEKCGGNPMCVKALSGLLCHSEVGLSEIGTLEDGIIPALRLCYDLLPAQLKQCFKFCSMFPKDYIFVKHYIIRLWISQGFIYPEEDSQPEDTALHYFNELFCRSFFQHSPFHNNQEDKFVMHELFHDLAHSVATDKCFRSEEPFCSLPENLCHLSLVLSDSKAVVLTKEDARLQSLLVVRRSDTRCSSPSIPVLNILHLNDLFLKCGFLSVLNLSYVEIIELPRSIGNMKHLRFLALNNTKIKSLPSEIGQIDILQTLELKDCCNLIELPESTKHLVKLRHLDVRKEQGNVHVGMPSGVRQLTDLQTLAIFNVGNDLLHCSIGDLKNLNGLRGHVHITGLENIKTGNDAREANLIGKHFIEALTMEWCYNTEDMENDLCEEIANQVLQNLQPNSSLQELVIRNYSGNSFPIWMQDSSLCKLVSVTIDDCKDCNELPSLGDLPYLKYLYIQRMNAVKRIGVKSNSLATEGKHAPRFPSLETLNLWEMYDLQFWEGISDGDFPRLCRLSISRCPKLINLPPFMSLLYLSFHCGDQLPTFSELPSLKSLKIAGFHKLKSITLSPEMLMLKKLEISDCKELLSVDDPWLTVSHLKVVRCPKLHFGGSSLEGCFTWEMLQRSAFGIHSQTKNTLLVKYMRAADHDGDDWNWTTYDQKDVLGSSFQRRYFRCSHKYQMGCMARKIAERNNDDPDTWSLTYISEHNHQQAVELCTEPSAEVIQLGTCTEPAPEVIQLGTTRKRKRHFIQGTKKKRRKNPTHSHQEPGRWDKVRRAVRLFGNLIWVEGRDPNESGSSVRLFGNLIWVEGRDPNESGSTTRDHYQLV